MTTTGERITDREMLIEIRGTVNRTAEDVSALRRDHGSLTDRVTKLENADAYDRGQKNGFERSARVVYALATITGLGGIAAAAKVLLPGLGVR